MATKKKSPIQSHSDLEVLHGKKPPQAIEIEEAVLGALMMLKDAYTIVSDMLTIESFYKESHQKIYKAITALASREDPIDMLTVTNELRKTDELDEVGGAYFITQLVSRIGSVSHLEYHARIVSQKYLQREMIKVSTELQTKAFEEAIDVKDLLDEAENAFFQLSQGKIKKDVVQIDPVIEQAIQKIKDAGKRTDGLSGCPSGFTGLDRLTSGWQASDLIIIAARPAMGKTAFVLSMTRNMAVTHKAGVAVFSLEMSNVQLVNRLISYETEITGEKIKKGNLDVQEWEQLDTKIQGLMNAPIYIDDTPGLSVFDLRAKARRLKKQHDIKIIIIDYLQLMTASGMNPGSREQEVSLISRSLKGLAKELDVPIIALSQLNRGVESRSGAEGKRPQLSDLRESGAIEQDADMVMFIHRPEYYRILEDEKGNSLIGMAEIIVAKHRNGATDDVRLRFRSELARFEDLDASPMDFNPEGAVTFGSRMNVAPNSFGNIPSAANNGGGNPFGAPGFNNDVPF